ncbi:hypothetical protein COS75_00865 [Candidatus Pacearchaeota archaeon CG06_land_8_20_14_3_00_35_12]|nr:MAG: hypothetical protein COS75_00865 [Candidatus Pacearchaeota archaeon CG06_land_8_20_14_3_00_35_12]
MNKFFFFILLSSFFLILNFQITASAVQKEDFFSYNLLTLNWSLQNQISSQADRLTAILNLYPRNDSQHSQIVYLNMTSIPVSEIDKNNNLSFKWETQAKGNLLIDVDGIILKNFSLQQIYSKIKYPENVPSDIEVYIEPSTFADSDNQYIKLKAQEILASSDTDDLLEIVHSVARYVSENTEYDYSYFSEIKPASWVLQNKRGVCDEYTNLFIALCRALDIPARYVSGVAFSNINDSFEEHAWAEVYVNGNWLPYDATFEQYGWVDATHIVYDNYVDAKSASTAISYSYIGGAISTSTPIVDTSILTYGQKLQSLTEISIILPVNKTGFNSYLPLEVNIRNLQPYYLSIPVVLGIAPGVYGRTSENVFLKPFSEEKATFIINIPDVSTMPQCRFNGCESLIGIKTIFGDNVTSKIIISSDYSSLSLAQAQEMLKGKSEEEIASQVISCIADKQIYYSNENISILCSINTNDELKICLKEDCKSANSQIKQLSFLTSAANENGSFNIIAKKLNGDVTAFSLISVKISSIPVLQIKSLENPAKIRYGEDTYVNLTVESSQIIDAIVTIKNKGNASVKFLQGLNKVQVPFSSLKLGYGNKSLEIKISFKDKNGQEYSVKDFAEFEIQDIGFFDKILVWLKALLTFSF